MDVRKRVGLNLKDARRQKGLSQDELAHDAGVHRTHLSGVESGHRNPSILVLEHIAKALGIDVQVLLRKRS
ncbi:MAG: helix-turn-helix domain-containing protein [Methylovirgula sp.]